jgi:hypothetical protein
MTFPKTIIIIVISVLWCISIVESDPKGRDKQVSDWPTVGTILPSDGIKFLGNYEHFERYAKDETDVYEYIVPSIVLSSRPFHFQIVKEVPRPDSITKNDTNRYHEYYEILCSGHTHADINFCDANAISYIDIDDTSTYLITTILSPVVITDTLLRINSTEWLAPGFNYKLALGDSLLAIGQIASGWPQVDIYRIGKNNEQIKLRTITEGFNVGMSFDCKQFFIERMVGDSAFVNSLKYEIMIYDIPTNKWTTLGSIEYSYSKPKRISRDDYLYFIKGRNNSYSLWRTNEGVPEELFFDPPPPEFVYDFSLDAGRWLTIRLLKVGEEPEYKNLRRKDIHLD